MVDLKGLHQAYTRLSEKFKTFWTFHQFLQGVHKTFFGNAPGYRIDFQALYNEIKAVAGAMTFQPPATVLDTINQLELQLEGVHRLLSEADQKISPNYVRRFFEKVRTEDEKLLLALLRFYFYSRYATHDELDKIDFLITIVGARRSLDDGHYIVRFPQELQKLFGSFLVLTRRHDVSAVEVRGLVQAFERLRKDIEECQRFEELTERNILENLRTLKHKVGAAFYTVEVLSAILEANLAAKNRFSVLYDAEEQRIGEAARHLEEIEREIEKNPDRQSAELKEEFEKFRQAKEGFEKDKSEGVVRHQDVTRLAGSIDSLLAKVDLSTPPAVAAKAPQAEVPAEVDPYEQLVAYSMRDPRAVAKSETPGAAAGMEEPEEPEAAEGEPALPARSDRSGVTKDALTGEFAKRLLYSVEALMEGTGSGQAAYGKSLARLRLEPWEVRAARRISSTDYADEEAGRDRDLLFVQAAALRLKIDEEAAKLRGATPADISVERLNECGQCLVRAQEFDRRFRQALEAGVGNAPPESQNELMRSRFRLIRGFSGLWLLHNARLGA